VLCCCGWWHEHNICCKPLSNKSVENSIHSPDRLLFSVKANIVLIFACDLFISDQSCLTKLLMLFACVLQVLRLLREEALPGPLFRAVVAVVEAMHARCADVTSQLVTQPLLEPLFRCLDSTGRTSFHALVMLRFSDG